MYWVREPVAYVPVHAVPVHESRRYPADAYSRFNGEYGLPRRDQTYGSAYYRPYVVHNQSAPQAYRPCRVYDFTPEIDYRSVNGQDFMHIHVPRFNAPAHARPVHNAEYPQRQQTPEWLQYLIESQRRESLKKQLEEQRALEQLKLAAYLQRQNLLEQKSQSQVELFKRAVLAEKRRQWHEKKRRELKEQAAQNKLLDDVFQSLFGDQDKKIQETSKTEKVNLRKAQVPIRIVIRNPVQNPTCESDRNSFACKQANNVQRKPQSINSQITSSEVKSSELVKENLASRRINIQQVDSTAAQEISVRVKSKEHVQQINKEEHEEESSSSETVHVNQDDDQTISEVVESSEEEPAAELVESKAGEEPENFTATDEISAEPVEETAFTPEIQLEEVDDGVREVNEQELSAEQVDGEEIDALGEEQENEEETELSQEVEPASFSAKDVQIVSKLREINNLVKKIEISLDVDSLQELVAPEEKLMQALLELDALETSSFSRNIRRTVIAAIQEKLDRIDLAKKTYHCTH